FVTRRVEAAPDRAAEADDGHVRHGDGQPVPQLAEHADSLRGRAVCGTSAHLREKPPTREADVGGCSSVDRLTQSLLSGQLSRLTVSGKVIHVLSGDDRAGDGNGPGGSLAGRAESAVALLEPVLRVPEAMSGRTEQA